MKLNDLANIYNCNFDKITNKQVSFEEKYNRIIRVLGYEEIKKCIPFTLKEIKNALKDGVHLNNLSMEKWDSAAGFFCGYQGKMIHVGSPLTNLYYKYGVNSYSASDGVCILKEAARMWVAE